MHAYLLVLKCKKVYTYSSFSDMPLFFLKYGFCFRSYHFPYVVRQKKADKRDLICSRKVYFRWWLMRQIRRESYKIKATKHSHWLKNKKDNLKKNPGVVKRLRVGCRSQKSSSALGGPTAAEQHLPHHTAHLVVVVPRQLRASPNPPARATRACRVSDRFTKSKCYSHNSGLEPAARNI